MNTDYTIIYRLLDDIHTSSQRILNLLKNINNENFIDDSLTEVQDIQDIVARRFTIIGEAAAKLLKNYPEFCKGHPELPLTHIRALRNIIIHEYNEIDWQVVWDISTNELTQLEEIINVSKQNLVLFNKKQNDTHAEGQNT
jgi:uncharacterized protein with HEPN domain